MKKILCIILFIITLFSLCGCAINEDKFPRLEIARSNVRADTIYIALRDNHNFSINHLYDEVETENGYDIVIHITKDN